MSAPLAVIDKDKDAKKPYTINFKKFLDPGDVIQTATWTVPAGLTGSDEALLDGGTRARIWIAGGVAEETYDVLLHIVTVGGLEDDVTLRFQILEE